VGNTLLVVVQFFPMRFLAMLLVFHEVIALPQVADTRYHHISIDWQVSEILSMQPLILVINTSAMHCFSHI